MPKLQSKGNFENYDSHFVPVIPPDGQISHSTSIYHPCKANQSHQYIEMVVFDSQQCLPRYLVELQPSFPMEPSLDANQSTDASRRKARPRSTAFYKPDRQRGLDSTSPALPGTNNTPAPITGNSVATPTSSMSAEEAYRQGLALYEENRFKQALPFLEKASAAKYPPAYLRLALIHSANGLVGPRDESRSAWYQQQAAANFNWYLQEAQKTKRPDAIFDVGECFYKGYGTPQDGDTAFSWFKKAAEGGHVFAQYQVGHCYQKGDCVEENATQAMIWYKKAADRGSALAQIHLGSIYCDDYEDSKTAMTYFLQAAEKEVGTAYAKIGFMYLDGTGIPVDITQAVHWLTKSAQTGVTLAKATLGWHYETAEGQWRDVQKAVFWYKQAMMQGDNDSADSYHRLITQHPWIQV